jgi:hypothetical protein
MSVRSICIAALALIAITDRGRAQDACFQRPTPVERLQDVRTHRLVLTDARGRYYVIDGSCFTLDRGQFPGVLYFSLLNSFSKDFAVTSGYVFIKSNRTFSNSPPERLLLSRGDGWFFPSTSGSTALVRMNFEPFSGSIEAWNAAHSNEGDPIALSRRLEVRWHAFAQRDMTSPSTRSLDFWKVDDSFDRTHGVITNYLLRFDVNTSDKVGLIPFQVYLQNAVQQIDLTIYSNVEVFSGQYKFIIQ